MTSKERHACEDCGFSAVKWFGKCPDCGSWNTAAVGSSREEAAPQVSTLTVIEGDVRISTGMEEVDRVLGGGLVAGEVALLSGEPGIGKSTLVLQMVDGVRREGMRPLLVSGEEAISQVSLRARRLGIQGDLPAVWATDLADVLALCGSERPDVLVVDSIQILADANVESPAGSPSQVRHCAAALVHVAKRSGTIVILVGHVTKDGSVAGPKALEHIVDAVLSLDGDRGGPMRLLRVLKNRFGSCEEIGVFQMNEDGLDPVPDPSSLLLADRLPGISGSLVFPGLEGGRPVLVEVQALVTGAAVQGQPRRVAIGLDARRLTLSLSVLGRRCQQPFGDRDVYAAVVGGLQVREPASDLPLALVLLSAKDEQPLPEGLVAFGEVGLGGEVRRVPGADRRLAEAARLGFHTAIVPRGSERHPPEMKIYEVADVNGAFHALEQVAEGSSKKGERLHMVSLDHA
jgi:DNA repair protein RadA/Sms